jgi:ATP-dependent DNA helicase RecG
MYDDHLEIVNPDGFHLGVTLEQLVQPHESRPWNPVIASVFYRAGIIERWGEGTLNILEWCKENASPPPIWEDRAESAVITFLPASPFESQPESQPESLALRVLRLLGHGPLSKSELSVRLGQKAISRSLNDVVRTLVTNGAIAPTIPDKPRSRLQRYRLTDQGRDWLSGQKVDA